MKPRQNGKKTHSNQMIDQTERILQQVISKQTNIILINKGKEFELKRRGHAVKKERKPPKIHYQCRFRSFWYVTSYDAGIERVRDDHHYTNAVDAFDAADVMKPTMRPDVANSTLIFFSSAIHHCLCLYFLMTSQSSGHELADHNNMDRLKYEKKQTNK